MITGCKKQSMKINSLSEKYEQVLKLHEVKSYLYNDLIHEIFT